MSEVPIYNAWMAETFSRLVLKAPENRLSDFEQQPVFDTSRMGVAAGNDPVFATLRKAVDARHFMPADLFVDVTGVSVDPSQVSVVSWALPFTAFVRRSNRGRQTPSPLYSLARNNGGALIQRVALRLKKAVEGKGYGIVIPTAVAEYDVFRSDEWTFSSCWSERHVAFAAGLGQFGLNGSLITSLGASVRLLSVVTDMPLERTVRFSDDYRAPCARGQGCSRCVDACPAGAVSSDGLDKSMCYGMRNMVRRSFLAFYVRDLDILKAHIVKNGKTSEGYSLGCALCQCGLPCEGRAPESRDECGNDA